MDTSFQVDTESGLEATFREEALKDLEIAQVLGLVGDEGAVAICSTTDFLNGMEKWVRYCRDATAVGRIRVEVSAGEGEGIFLVSLYSLVTGFGGVVVRRRCGRLALGLVVWAEGWCV